MQQRIFLFLMIIFSSFFQQVYADPPLPIPVGRVVWVEGTFTATMPNKEQRILQSTSLIYLHDTLATDTLSKAEIIFTDKTVMTLRPNSQFYIDQYVFNPRIKKGSMGKYVMNLIDGGFRTITGLIAKSNPSDYEINTPVATILSEGVTDYGAYTHGARTYVAYYSGQPCIRNKKAKICLNPKKSYVLTSETDIAPLQQMQQVSIFKEKEVIIPAKISPFMTQNTHTPGGPTKSFCLSE